MLESPGEPQRRVTVYGCYGSFCTQKVYLTLAEKGVKAQRRMVNIGPSMENYEPWYAAINPRMVIPTLDDDGTIVCDSSVIIRHIDTNFDGPSLIPEDPAQRQQVEEWIRRIDQLSIRELSYGVMRGALSHLRDRLVMPMRLRVLRRHQRRAPDLHDVYQARIDDVLAWIQTMNEPADMAALRAELDGILDDLEAALADDGFVVGDAYSLADMMATVLVARLRFMKQLADLETKPKLVAHYLRMRERPGFPSTDIAEKMDKGQMFRLVAPFLLPRMAAMGLLVGAIGFGVWWLASAG